MTFDDLADRAVRAVGHPAALGVVTVAIIVSHLALGVDATNFAISIASLVLLLILQRSQNRDSAALEAKLDEIIKGVPDADNAFVGLDRRPQDEIDDLRAD
jgi:low affinity Fe/Cu permease